MDSDLQQLKQQLIHICIDLEYPQSQQALNFIKSALGSIMMEQERQYHIQYTHGVQLDLSNRIFDDEDKLRRIIDFVTQLRETARDKNSC